MEKTTGHFQNQGDLRYVRDRMNRSTENCVASNVTVTYFSVDNFDRASTIIELLTTVCKVVKLSEPAYQDTGCTL